MHAADTGAARAVSRLAPQLDVGAHLGAMGVTGKASSRPGALLRLRADFSDGLSIRSAVRPRALDLWWRTGTPALCRSAPGRDAALPIKLRRARVRSYDCALISLMACRYGVLFGRVCWI
ncbi:hypothetical protein DGN21_15330 [Xanthomonas sp. MLO165]|nr:hypothetical protein DGN21_15330 [Xanthomonas sp. MLO165]